MKTLILLSIVLLIGLTSCDKSDATKFSKVDAQVMAYVSQPDSLVKDTVLCVDNYDYIVKNKHVSRVYYVNYHTDELIIACSLGLILIMYTIGYLIESID